MAAALVAVIGTNSAFRDKLVNLFSTIAGKMEEAQGQM